MKIILVAILTFFSTFVNAEMYKCTVGKHISFQDKPCKETGSVGYEIKKRPDISKEQQRKALLRLESELTLMAEQDQLDQEAYDKERKIRAEEEKAFATQEYTKQVRRQAEALEERNYIESKKPKVIYNHWNHHSNLAHPINKYDTEQVKRPFVQEKHLTSSGIFPKNLRNNNSIDNKHKK